MQQSRLRKSLILRFPNACRFWHRAQKRQREQFCFQALLRTENGAAICNMCFCLHGELCKEWWLNVDLKELLPQSIVAWMWSEYCNCFFNMRFSSSSCALRFCNSLFRCPLFWHASMPKCAHKARRRGAVPDSQALILSNNSTLTAKLPALKKYEILLFKTAEIFFGKPYKNLTPTNRQFQLDNSSLKV